MDLDMFSSSEANQPITGNKDLGCKWNFVPKPKGTMKRDREDSSFDPFKDNEVRCLVRDRHLPSEDGLRMPCIRDMLPGLRRYRFRL